MDAYLSALLLFEESLCEYATAKHCSSKITNAHLEPLEQLFKTIHGKSIAKLPGFFIFYSLVIIRLVGINNAHLGLGCHLPGLKKSELPQSRDWDFIASRRWLPTLNICIVNISK